ncbi:MAG: hypothetical protein M5U12_08175 [Verrucomicrobia bacterium]|nr:hypothetical protein [Verrucomicrobiota bacterium]
MRQRKLLPGTGIADTTWLVELEAHLDVAGLDGSLVGHADANPVQRLAVVGLRIVVGRPAGVVAVPFERHLGELRLVAVLDPDVGRFPGRRAPRRDAQIEEIGLFAGDVDQVTARTAGAVELADNLDGEAGVGGVGRDEIHRVEGAHSGAG